MHTDTSIKTKSLVNIFSSFTKFLMNILALPDEKARSFKPNTFLSDSSDVCVVIGGAEEDRTPDPLRARQVLSQLSYDPIFCGDILLYSSL